MNGKDSRGKCEYFDKNGPDSSETATINGWLYCANGGCSHVGGCIGKYEGEGPVLYECGISEALLGEKGIVFEEHLEDKGLAKKVASA